MTRDVRTAPGSTPPDAAGRSVADAMRSGREYLRACGNDDAATDSRRLVLHVTGMTALDLVRDDTRVLTDDEALRFRDALRRRAQHEPVSRIVGSRGFYGRDFLVTRDTLDPRPDTETLIEATLALCRESGLDQRPVTIADIGTGTGCILISLLAELPHARGIGIDVSAKALEVARENARRHGVVDRVTFVEGRGLVAAARDADIVVSNPPYIPSGDIAGLDRDVRDHDPLLALDGGPDGLDIYREIASALRARSAPGWVLFEVGAGQADDAVKLLMHALGANHADGRERGVRLFRDLGGIARCVALSTQS